MLQKDIQNELVIFRSRAPAQQRESHAFSNANTTITFPTHSRSGNNVSGRDCMAFICKARKLQRNWRKLHCGWAEQKIPMFFWHSQRILEESCWLKSRFRLTSSLKQQSDVFFYHFVLFFSSQEIISGTKNKNKILHKKWKTKQWNRAAAVNIFRGNWFHTRVAKRIENYCTCNAWWAQNAFAAWIVFVRAAFLNYFSNSRLTDLIDVKKTLVLIVYGLRRLKVKIFWKLRYGGIKMERNDCISAIEKESQWLKTFLKKKNC